MHVPDVTTAGPLKSSRSWPAAVRIVGSYVVFATLWILLSDRAVLMIAHNRDQAASLQSVKGVLFVVITALMLYGLLRRALRQRDTAIREATSARERFEMVARASNDAIYDWDVHSNHIWWNEGFQHLFGYMKEEFEPTLAFWTNCLHPDDRARVVASLKQGIATGPSWSAEYRFRRKDGTYAHVHDQGLVLRDAQGRPTRMVGGMIDITDRKNAAEQLELSRRQLRALSARIEQLREEERTYIAREIHDELGQMLTGIKMDLHWAEKRLADTPDPPRAVLDKIADACELADRTIDCVQRISSELRPDVLDHLGLAAAIKYEAQRFEKRTGIRTRLLLLEKVPNITKAAATALFRICQELLTNVARHAEATEVEVTLTMDAEELHLHVRDNGHGITPEALSNPRSLGLLGMRERASLLGGSVTFERVSPAGTLGSARIPLRASDPRLWELV